MDHSRICLAVDQEIFICVSLSRKVKNICLNNSPTTHYTNNHRGISARSDNWPSLCINSYINQFFNDYIHYSVLIISIEFSIHLFEWKFNISFKKGLRFSLKMNSDKLNLLFSRDLLLESFCFWFYCFLIHINDLSQTLSSGVPGSESKGVRIFRKRA